MSDRGSPGETADDIVPVEVAGDMTHGAVRMEMRAVETRYAGALLTAMLESMQPKRDEARGIAGTPYAENPAFLAKLVVVERIGRQHRVPERLCCREIVI